MTKREKRLTRLKQNINNVSFEDLRKVLEDHGFVLKSVSGSHFTFHAKIETKSYRITIPRHRPVKSVYVDKAFELIELINIQGLQKDENIDEGTEDQEQDDE